MKELDLRKIPLEGTHIIEASAGTGKTYSISNIFLRFILEKKIPAEKILIVSFTESAVNELKQRIRKRIQEAIEATAGKRKDDFIDSFIDDKEMCLALLKGALRDLDSITISTIHGFCRKVIVENAFETGSLLDTQLIVDQDLIKKEIMYDFWRKWLYKESPLFIDYVIKKGFNFENLSSLVDICLTKPYIKIIPELSYEDLSGYEEKYMGIFSALSDEWNLSKTEIRDILKSEAIKKNRYRNLEEIFEYMEYFVNTGGCEFGDLNIIKKFTKSYIEESLKKGFKLKIHPFFEICEEFFQISKLLESMYKRKMSFLKAELVRYMKEELEKRKASKGVVSFDDLLMIVYRGIMQNELLVSCLRERYLVGIIDEFQDTDPIQYQIFRKIFSSKDHALYLIGDPKQSIYSFRGADVFTYIKAGKEIDSKFTLKENYRSLPDLIEAVNAIFLKNKTPFVYKEIEFIPSEAPENSSVSPIYLDKKKEACLKVWIFEEEKRKSDIKEVVSKAVANEISRLLYLGKEGRLTIGEKPVRASDIAVLVRKNSEARLIQEELSRLHIPAVIYSTTSIFDSWECKEVLRILNAIYQYRSEGYLRSALGTDILGKKGEDLERMNEKEWEEWIKKFREYHEIWKRSGFVVMFKEFLEKEDVFQRLMKFQDGERRCTNILHLMEVIHRGERENQLGMEGIIKWISEKKNERSTSIDEYQLRLESDEDAVKVITIHRSKGLEFPIVFLPFMWDIIKRSHNSPVIFHDPEDELTSVLDLGSDMEEENRKKQEKEILAEDIRILYVGLTRAKNCCYVVWAKTKDFKKSSLYYLLFQEKEIASLEGIKEQLERILKKDSVIFSLPDKAYSFFEEKEEELYVRKLSKKIDKAWAITSFSNLTSNIDEYQDFDRETEKEEAEQEESFESIFSFPKGTRAGTFFHSLLQELDFQEKDEGKIKELIERKLEEFGFEVEWKETIFKLIKDLLEFPIDPEIGLKLSDISKKDRLNEFEFYFPLKRITDGLLKRILKIEGLRFDTVEGFMRGFIDMVFFWKGKYFIVDWKSNFLGNSIKDYSERLLEVEMKKRCYELQYLIYTVAVDQYLRKTVPSYSYQKDFGKVYYVFLRGIDSKRDPSFGVYRKRPDPKVLSELRKILIPE